MKLKNVLKILIVSGLLICIGIIFAVSSSAQDYPPIDLTKVGKNLTLYKTVYENLVFENASCVTIGESEIDSLKAVVEDPESAPNTYTLTVLNAGQHSLSITDTNEVTHNVTLEVHKVFISENYFTFGEYRHSIPFNGKEQPFLIQGDYQGHPITFTAEYKELIGPADNDYVRITGTGNFYGSFSKLYSIAIAQTKIVNVVHSKNALKVELKNCGALYRYQLQMRKNGGVWQNFDLKTNTTKAFTGLKAKDKYQFRARTYVIVDGKNRFSDFNGWDVSSVHIVGLSLNDCKITGVVNKVYTGKAQKQNVKVTYNGKPIKVKVSYADNKTPGYRYIVLKGTGDFVDSIKVYYHILPTAPKITGLVESYNEKEDAFSGFGIYTKKPAGITPSGYQFAVKMKGSDKWQYFEDMGNRVGHAVWGLKEGKIYYVMARVYVTTSVSNLSNGVKTYGKWSAQERVYLCNKEIHTDFFYYTQDTIYGSVTRVFKGEKATVTVDGKTYTVVFNRDAKEYKFQLKIGKHKPGTKLVIQYINKFGQSKITYTTVTYYLEDLRKGLSGAQVKLVPYFEQPNRVSKQDGNVIWEYAWQVDEETGFYAVLTFCESKLIKWEYYEIAL